jgi:hypothetical protein
MEHHITVDFARDRAFEFHLQDNDTADMAWEQAQNWIDEEFVRTAPDAVDRVGTTPLGEKIACIAAAYGPQPFANDTAWARRFVRCTGRTVGKVKITVDVVRQTVAL